MKTSSKPLVHLNRRTHISRFFIVPSQNGFYDGIDGVPAFDKVNSIHLFSAFQDENGQLFLEGNYGLNEFYLCQAHDWNGDLLLNFPLWQGNNLISHICQNMGGANHGLENLESRILNRYFISPITQNWVEQVGQFPNVILNDAITRLDVILFIGANILEMIPNSEVEQLKERGWTDVMSKHISNTIDFIIQGGWRISCDLTFPEIVIERGFEHIEDVFI
jgi:hypothetical protein